MGNYWFFGFGSLFILDVNYYNLSPREKRKREVAHARHEIEEWRKFYAITKEPAQKLFAESQINYHVKTINQV